MALTIKLAAVFCLASAPGFAGNWTGFLVDSKCYEALERNKSPSDTLNYVDRDRGSEIRYCHPNRKTKAFAVVDQNGLSFRLDSGGNAKAAALLDQATKKPIFVTLNGEMSGDTVKVDSIAVAR